MPEPFQQTSLEPGFSFGGPLDIALSQEIKDTQTYSKLVAAPFGSDRYWMIETLRESLKGIGITNPNPAVGCILVDSGGKEIARGCTQAFLGLHAERVAFHESKITPFWKGQLPTSPWSHAPTTLEINFRV